MPDIKGTTRAQTLFLRAFARHPNGPPADQWPSPVVLRRWLKRPGFCGAMNSVLRAMRYHADFHLTAAAASGANLILSSVQNGDATEARRNIESLAQLLRIHHVRQRFADPLPEPQPRTSDLLEALHLAHPDITVRDALYCNDVLAREGLPGKSMKLWARTGHPQSPMYKPQVEEDEQEIERR